MVQYLLSVHSTDADTPPSPEVMEMMYAQVDTFNEEIKASGNWVFAGGLHPVTTATVVDATGAEVVVLAVSMTPWSARPTIWVNGLFHYRRHSRPTDLVDYRHRPSALVVAGSTSG